MKFSRKRRALHLSVLATLILLPLAPPWDEAAAAQPAPRADGAPLHTYHIAAQALGSALREFSAQSGVQILFSQTEVEGLSTGGLEGSFTPSQALERLLAGSGLNFEFPKSDAAIIHKAGNAAHSAGGSNTLAGSNASTGAGSSTSPAAVPPSTGAPASSGNDPSASLADVEEVVITGRAGVEDRTKEETSYSITTIDQERMRMQGPTSVTESLKSVPGFWVEASGGEASGNVRARGIPVDGFGSITLLEDGIPVQNDPGLGWLNADQAFRIDETIDRIEVVRGGPSSIFYSNAPAGAVNYISRRPGDQAEGTLKYTVGDYGLNRIDAWYGAPLGDDWKLAIGGFYRYDNGIRNPGFHGDDGGQARVSLFRDFEHGKVSFDLKRMDDTVFFDQGIPLEVYPGGKIRAVPGLNGNYGTIAGPDTALVSMTTGTGGSFLFDNTGGTHVNRTQATAKFELQLAPNVTFTDALRRNDMDTLRNGLFSNTVQSGASLLKAENSYLANYPGATALQLRYVDSPGTVFNLANQNDNGLTVVGGLRSVSVPLTELMNDARLMGKFSLGGQTHDWSLGFYVADVNMGFTRYSSSVLLDVQNNARLLNMVAVNSAGNVVGTLTDNGIWRDGYEWANANGQSTTTAFYLADEWQVTPRLRIDAGLRWEQIHLTGNDETPKTVSLGTLATSQILTGSGQFTHFEGTFSKVGWTLGEDWQFSERSGLFARYTPTFRLPSLTAYEPTEPTTPVITQTMQLGEIGYKYANHWANAYATAFWTKYNDVAFSNYVFNLQSGVSFPQQGYADTKTYGLELEGGLYPVDWFDFTLNSTLENPKYGNLVYTSSANGSPVLLNYEGNQLILVPKVSVRLVPGFNLLHRRLRVQFAWEYDGARYADTANSMVLPAYTVLNASGRYLISDRFSLYGYVDNVTNSQGLTEGNPRQGELQSADAGANVFIARPILGRAYRLSLMYQF